MPLLSKPVAPWGYAQQGVSGAGYEETLWTIVVPAGYALSINRFGCGDSLNSNYTLLVGGTAHPHLTDIGEKTFGINSGTGLPENIVTTHKNCMFDVDGAVTEKPIRGSFLLVPIVVDSNVEVSLSAKTSVAGKFMAGGVSGYYFDKARGDFAAIEIGG